MPKEYIEGASNRLGKVEKHVNEKLDNLNGDADVPEEVTIEFMSYKKLNT